MVETDERITNDAWGLQKGLGEIHAEVWYVRRPSRVPVSYYMSCNSSDEVVQKEWVELWGEEVVPIDQRVASAVCQLIRDSVEDTVTQGPLVFTLDEFFQSLHALTILKSKSVTTVNHILGKEVSKGISYRISQIRSKITPYPS